MKSNLKLGIALCVLLVCILATEYQQQNKSLTKQHHPVEEGDFPARLLPEFKLPLDTGEILQTFFSEGELKGKNLIRWKPELEEKLHMHVAPDGFCYTKLDTIVTLHERAGQKLFVFHTGVYTADMEIDECHPCAPNYSAGVAFCDDETIRIQSFSKNLITAGAWGEGGELEVLEVNGSMNILKITSGHTGMNEAALYENLFDLQTLKYMLSYQSYNSVQQDYENQFYAEENIAESKTELKTELNEFGTYDLILARKEIKFDSLQERVITNYSTKVYRWNENNELELCYE